MEARLWCILCCSELCASFAVLFSVPHFYSPWHCWLGAGASAGCCEVQASPAQASSCPCKKKRVGKVTQGHSRHSVSQILSLFASFKLYFLALVKFIWVHMGFHICDWKMQCMKIQNQCNPWNPEYGTLYP